ncbi:hypothetical protein [Methanospirillum stamsii]|uniref:hypothetical protein n=1 Tax=Methanospirillum stamsii TaxID=1277351 RepID=UPI003183FFB4
MRFYEFLFQDKPVVLLEIPAAAHTPVSFHDQEFIRVGSYKKRLKEYPEKERALWQIFSRTSFESLIAASGMSDARFSGCSGMNLTLNSSTFPSHQIEPGFSIAWKKTD